MKTIEKTKHEKVLDELIADDPRWKKAGLKKAFEKALTEAEDIVEEDEDFKYEFPHHLGFIPDAFQVNKETRTVVMLEIEDKSVLDKNKMRRIAEFAFGVDCYSWFCELHVHNVLLGKTSVLSDSDLISMWHAYIDEDARHALD